MGNRSEIAATGQIIRELAVFGLRKFLLSRQKSQKKPALECRRSLIHQR